MTELTTERLVLRAHRERDIEPTVAMYADELSERWLSNPRPYTLEDARRWCVDTVHLLRAMGDGVHWVISDARSGCYLGGIGVRGTDWLRRCTEIGYAVTPSARGRGYAPEALRAAAQWILREQGFNRVELLAATANTASQRVAEKAGFVREGVARNRGFTHEGQQDMVVFSLIPGDLARR
ncbi:GNAT family N-acetyltransferase [Actinocrinis puniceicyclus]|uniref:GNAT family N-acetyltransferase n=1 Tax=Actinocrinis puniceicyclus TaxID=977794 RepID=A0A8J8BF99_9ACTN|nr:GNAT family N-acetyltransferase [Actinocrinis puniceicyclus]MBS2964539.1 GNAT family N-acetyltransferase [Actinocrinis puniceicyclus]